jgi:hypothetical protein
MAPIIVEAYAQNLKKFPKADATAWPFPRAPGRSDPGAYGLLVVVSLTAHYQALSQAQSLLDVVLNRTTEAEVSEAFTELCVMVSQAPLRCHWSTYLDSEDKERNLRQCIRNTPHVGPF